MNIRPTSPDDVAYLSEFWYDHMALLQQSNRRVRLAPHARRTWEQSTRALFESQRPIAYTAEIDAVIQGGILVRIIANEAGLLPLRYGRITDLLVDLHTIHRREPIASQLLDAAKADLDAQGITHIEAKVATQAMLPQAFWRSLGAFVSDEIIWMQL